MWFGFFYFLEPEQTVCPAPQPSMVVEPAF